jgi:DNA helicase-2/ATP-dependent DNA helicase PcrA
VGSAETKAFPFDSLVFPLHELLVSAGMADQGPPSLATRSRLFHALRCEYDPEMPLGEWISQFENVTDLLSALRKATSAANDLEALEQLMDDVAPNNRLAGHRLADFAHYGRVEGKVVLTTLHSSKGREFDAVILPGLVEGLIPRRPWDRSTRKYVEPAKPVLGEDRRLFYVGFTRARRMVFLVFSDSYTNQYGYPVNLGPSRFVREISARLKDT